MAKPVRTFVALEISEATRRRTLQLIEQLRRAQADVRWVDGDNLHVTLKFLGDVDQTALADVCRAVGQASALVPPFEMEVRGAGAYPNLDRPRIIWLGVGQGHEQVSQLFQHIDTALSDIGFAPEQRKFHPHVTLGRIRRAWKGVADLADLIRKRADFEAGTTAIDRVTVFTSQLGRDGPRYEAIGHLPLANA